LNQEVSYFNFDKIYLAHYFMSYDLILKSMHQNQSQNSWKVNLKGYPI